MTYSKHEKNVADVKSQFKISFTVNKVSESCGLSNFTQSANLVEPTSPTVQKQLLANPVLLSAVTKAEILFVVSYISFYTQQL